MDASSSTSPTVAKKQRSGAKASFLRPSLLLLDSSDSNLKLAAQVGVETLVAPYPGKDLDSLQGLVSRVGKFGLEVSVIERFWPHDQIVHALEGRDAQIEDTKELIRNMGKVGIKTLCYNWMQASDWTRTSVTVQERGGSLVSAYDEASQPLTVSGQVAIEHVATADELWASLEYFLKEVIPVCEASGVSLALHPDDPPVPVLQGKPQILHDIAGMQRAVSLVPSKANGVCFCQGTYASGGVDVVSAIGTLGKHITFVHFRDVVGSVPSFREAWQDTGDTDMAACVRAYRDAGLEGVPIRPDHVPTMEGEDNSQSGYHMLGRLFAVGYIKGLLDSAAYEQGDGKGAP